MANSADTHKQENILAAARELFFRFGYHKTSMTDIARSCGLAKASLYYYYGNKEAIFEEIVMQEAEAIMDAIESMIPNFLAPDEKIRKFYRLIYEKLRLHAEQMAGLPDFICDHYPLGRPILQKIRALMTRRLTPLVEDGMKTGLFITGNGETMIATLTYMTDFLTIDWIREHTPEEGSRIIEMMLTVVLDGIRRRH